MSRRRQGIPRNQLDATRAENFRRPQGNRPQRYGSYSQLDEALAFPGNREDNASSSGMWRHRTASTSSEQSYPRRNNSGFGNRNTRDNSNRNPRENGNRNPRDNRDQNNFHTRRNQNQNFRTVPSSSHTRNKRPIGFKALEALLEKDPEELVLELSNSNRGISELIIGGLVDSFMVLFVKILRKVTDTTFDMKYKVLQIYVEDNFVDQLTKYILFLTMPQNKDHKYRNSYFWKNPDEFWNNLIGICQEISNSMPTLSRKVVLPILKSLSICFPNFENEHKCHIADEIKENVKTLLEVVEILVKEYEESEKAKKEKKLNNNVEEEPPDDFRHISVYPTSLELVGGIPVFLRQNVVEGPYRDVNHYLDVQFRLLREDFVGPLRTAISTYRSEAKRPDEKKRIENVKIYKRVKFLNPETVNEQFCIRLRFDFSNKKKNFKYENSKRFMFGSLLCFTLDNFKNIIFGKVAERKTEDLEKGELIVGFDQNIFVDFKADYLMVEYGVYFEPYYHVLNVLQTMSVDNFPMEKYIIRVDASVEPPEYLTSPGCTYTIRGHAFAPLVNWPGTNFYHLNDSQLTAFKAALTQEFSIIQGPPGTGKTFLGLKIARTLLENHELWYNKTPMLVICYTNHALDQFLEGITEFTEEIVRVGGQSKNEKLQSYNLRNRKRFRMSAAVYQQRNEVEIVLGQIKNITENLKQIEYYHSIRAFDVFEEVIPNFRNSWFSKARRDEILDWLLSGKEDFVPANATGRYVDQISEGIANLKVEDTNEDDAVQESESEDDTDENLEDQLDDLFDTVKNMSLRCSIPLVTLSSMDQAITQLYVKVSELEQKENPTTNDLIYEDKYRLELLNQKARYDYLNARLIEGKQNRASQKAMPQFVDLKQPHNMTPNDRWDLYFYWLDEYKKKMREKLQLLNEEFREVYKAYEELRDIENTGSMKNALVVGITTTGAARLRSSLQALRSPIVIVEEAAEVLEAHIVSSLTKHCQQLILIGDHQQLKPSTANFSVERFYHLGISLFERMVINDIQLYTLNVQHRMRPEISSLISPAIYPALEDHPSVRDRPTIKGLDSCLFFIDHTHPEAECEGTSKKNYHEASFLIQFAKHLILNGYKPENITILAAYLGQMFEMQKEKQKHKHVLGNMRIAVLDNYQGEECDIILLSLVRSNTQNKIGFLSIENRVCVALSRARNGFYIMGNMTQLCGESKLWEQMRATLDKQNAIGTELQLRCQVHPDKITYVKKGDDFLQIPEGGCNQKCGADLSCGHKCTSLCHILDREHDNYKCRETCNKRLCDMDPNHVCVKMCYQECGPCYYRVPRSLPCGHTINLECHIDPDTHMCNVLVSTTLPCGHVADKPCHRDPLTFRCPYPCEVMVEPCGHACMQSCHVRKDPDHLQYKCTKKCALYRKNCTVQTDLHKCPKLCYEECEPCVIRVRKKRSKCPHVYDVPCSSDVDEIVCEKPCSKTLACGHKCKSKCCEPCGKCEIKVEKRVALCGHPVKVKCCEEPSRDLCSRKCPLKLPCGHNCTKKCNEPCTTHCKEIVDCNLRTPCGHTLTRVKCWITRSESARQNSATLLKYCNQPCSAELECKHACSGSCGECHQGRVHKRCTAKCGFPLICNHPCEFPCREACRPCSRPCPFKCQHASCSKRCGDACTTCKEPCTRRCRHRKCTKFCGDICDVPPCDQPCEKRLRCGHACVGFCGDPCPPKCLVCDKEELTTIFLGFEDEEDARFVLLKDCGHVFESIGLDGWMNRDGEKIGFKECPQCKTLILTSQRYSDLIKKALADVAKVKNKFYGNVKEINDMRGKLVAKVTELRLRISVGCIPLQEFLQQLETRLKADRKGKRQQINKPELNAIQSKLQITEHIINIYRKVHIFDSSWEDYMPQVKFMVQILSREEDSITDQEIKDMQCELNRLTRMTEFSQIKKSPQCASQLPTNSKVKLTVERIVALLYNITKFGDRDEENVKGLLERLNKEVASGIGISEKERREIVQAVGLKQGHWYKCPNGHPYAIGECGGAMQEAVCPECKARIGGSHHRLTAGNSLATEMDGARFAAWSEEYNNMANFDLN